MGDRIAVMNKGRIIQIGRPQDVYSRPVNTFVASFVGSPAINLIGGQVTGGAAVVSPGAFELPIAGAGNEGRYTFGIRPEDVKVEAGAPVAARVHDIENHGIEKVVTLRVGDTLVRANVPARVAIGIEDEVRFGWNAEKVMLFDAESGRNIRVA